MSTVYSLTDNVILSIAQAFTISQLKVISITTAIRGGGGGGHNFFSLIIIFFGGGSFIPCCTCNWFHKRV